MVVTALSKGGKHAAIRLSQHTRQVDAVGAELRELPRFRSEEGVGASAAALRRVSGRRQECRRGPGCTFPAARAVCALRLRGRAHGAGPLVHELLQPREGVAHRQERKRAPAARIQAAGALLVHPLGGWPQVFGRGVLRGRGASHRSEDLGVCGSPARPQEIVVIEPDQLF